MMTKDEALKMAIEAFKTCETYNAYEQSFEILLVEKAINACKEALAQAEAEKAELVRQCAEIYTLHNKDTTKGVNDE